MFDLLHFFVLTLSRRLCTRFSSVHLWNFARDFINIRNGARIKGKYIKLSQNNGISAAFSRRFINYHTMFLLEIFTRSCTKVVIPSAVGARKEANECARGK